MPLYIRYSVYLWTPPILTPEQEIQIGHQIVVEGREVFLKRAPYFSHEDQRHIEAARHYTTKQRIVLGTIFAAMMIAVVVLFWPILLGIIPILLYSGGSLLHARNRYHRWVDDLIAKYAASITPKPRNANREIQAS
jgi:hypothetical protein